MSGSIEKLRQSLAACNGCVNDHDYICRCRPVDVRRVLAELERLQQGGVIQAVIEFIQDVIEALRSCKTVRREQTWSAESGGVLQTLRDVIEEVLGRGRYCTTRELDALATLVMGAREIDMDITGRFESGG